MSKNMLLWLLVGVAAYFLFLRKAPAAATSPGGNTSNLPPATDIVGSTAQGIVGEIGNLLGVQQ